MPVATYQRMDGTPLQWYSRQYQVDHVNEFTQAEERYKSRFHGVSYAVTFSFLFLFFSMMMNLRDIITLERSEFFMLSDRSLILFLCILSIFATTAIFLRAECTLRFFHTPLMKDLPKCMRKRFVIAALLPSVIMFLVVNSLDGQYSTWWLGFSIAISACTLFFTIIRAHRAMFIMNAYMLADDAYIEQLSAATTFSDEIKKYRNHVERELERGLMRREVEHLLNMSNTSNRLHQTKKGAWPGFSFE